MVGVLKVDAVIQIQVVQGVHQILLLREGVVPLVTYLLMEQRLAGINLRTHKLSAVERLLVLHVLGTLHPVHLVWHKVELLVGHLVDSWVLLVTEVDGVLGLGYSLHL